MLAHNEIIIIGGGPVGLAQALKLSQQNKQVVVIDKSFNYEHDGRVLAISYLGCNIIREIGVDFNNLSCTRIEQVEISYRGLGISVISHDELELPELGVTVSYTKLCTELYNLVKQQSSIKLITQEVATVKNLNSYSVIEFVNGKLVTCDLLIMAEGGQLLDNVAKKRNYDYQQSACIFHIKTQKKPNNIAYERFSGLGPLVLLPYEDHYVVVWSLASSLVDELKDNSEQLLQLLNDDFTKRLGQVELISTVKTFPLRLAQVQTRIDKRMVVIGNSAQTVHPVSAQGLNLGLRDVQILSDLLKQEDYLNNMQQYDGLRDFDVNSVINFTHLLATKLEYSDSSIVNHLRGAGLIALSNLPVVKNFVARSLIFGL